MSDKLGFTFYPKDWWTSETFFELSPAQRYIYLECLFLMYSNDGVLKTQKTQFENRIRISVSQDDWNTVTDLFILEDGVFTHPSVNKRLRKAISNRENGKKGGRPRKDEKTQKTQKNNPKKPTLERERERESEKEIELKINDQQKIDFDDQGKPYDKFEPEKPKQGKSLLFESMDQVYRICLEASGWQNDYAKSAMIPLADNPQDWIKKFQTHALANGDNHLTLKDYRSHCTNWTRKQIEMGAKVDHKPVSEAPKKESAIARLNRSKYQDEKNGKI